jgi:hypothetical protein
MVITSLVLTHLVLTHLARRTGDKDFAIVLSESDFSSEPTPVKRPRVSRQSGSSNGKAAPAARDAVTGTPGDRRSARVDPPKPGYVQCPSCSMTVRETLLNHHLDRYCSYCYNYWSFKGVAICKGWGESQVCSEE